MNVLLDSLYWVALVASLIFLLGVVLVLGFADSRFSKLISFCLWTIVVLIVFSSMFEDLIPDDINACLDIVSSVCISAYHTGMFLLVKKAEKSLGKPLFKTGKLNRYLLIFALLVLAIGVSIFVSKIDVFYSENLIYKLEAASSLTLFVCVSVFPLFVLVDKVEIRQNGAVFVDCRNLSEMAVAKKVDIDSLRLDSPRNLLRMTYTNKVGERKEVGTVIKNSYIGKLVTALDEFGLNSSS